MGLCETLVGWRLLRQQNVIAVKTDCLKLIVWNMFLFTTICLQTCVLIKVCSFALLLSNLLYVINWIGLKNCRNLLDQMNDVRRNN